MGISISPDAGFILRCEIEKPIDGYLYHFERRSYRALMRFDFQLSQDRELGDRERQEWRNIDDVCVMEWGRGSTYSSEAVTLYKIKVVSLFCHIEQRRQFAETTS